MQEKRTRLVILVFGLVALVALAPSLLVFGQTKTVWIDRETCRFRVTESWLGVPGGEWFRESWITELVDDGSAPDWEPVLTRRGDRISVWHGVAGSFSTNLRNVSHPIELGYLSDDAIERIGTRVLSLLCAEADPVDGLWLADRWLECFNERLVWPSERDAVIDDADVARWMDECSAD